ncbi:MAG: aminotransferase class I/II-fold pyridoxal phosphate-dependent enzyme [Paracoccaceae bacterium]|jgi:aspartate/methionine/tyrosine aminotransferase|nr:aminotransferase class I/II-fold pyridoxal phosphate-dependent enzyme [Paracoccaceae bacterium]MDG1369952.1 aminotransferase class I/II-fold pyridoxal phosphate-dependent enzyme [Paracoccaceae bacterium]MDG1969696.1 aminotransferase class I/II-fold pyridoxal phosphate-dependent enzyme [Paracoccaceae bacterium]
MQFSRRGEVNPFIVMDVMEDARRAEAAGASVIHMEVGQPGTPAPRLAREAVNKAMSSEALGYTVALGLPELRERISKLYRNWYGIDVPASRIIVTAGSSAGFLLSFLAMFDAGQRVATIAPGYPSYRNILKGLDIEVVELDGAAASGWRPTPEMIAGAGDIDGLLVASPSNPTGAMLDRASLQGLINAARAKNAVFISDEIYHGLHYGERAVTALELSDDVVVINSFSKYFSMTGWRVGWMVAPEPMVRVVERLAQNFFICPAHVSQVAALAAIDAVDECEANLTVYRKNREVLLEELPKAEFTKLAPCEGAFYIYAEVDHLTGDSREFCKRMLAEAGVAATPGHDFDPMRGAQTVRFSFARSTEDMVEGARRLKAWLG